MSEFRRRLMTGNISNPYDDFVIKYDTVLNSDGTESYEEGYCVVEYIPIENSLSISFSIIDMPYRAAIVEYDEFKKIIDHWNAQNGTHRTVNLTGKERTKYIGAVFKGKNVNI